MSEENIKRKVVPVTIGLHKHAHQCTVRIGEDDLAVSRIEVVAAMGEETRSILTVHRHHFKEFFDAHRNLGIEVIDGFGGSFELHRVLFIDGEFSTKVEFDSKRR